MKLYLHIGTEKTGSSYLQSVAAINRAYLKEKGIHFPTAGKREKQLLNGEISAGNAQPLADAIKAGNRQEVIQLLHEHLADAQAKKCQRVLLSNEMLLLALSQEDKVAKFQHSIREAGFTSAHYLLILRDPVDQALSLYKHRAKSGTAADIEEWVSEHYHYGDGLYNFLQQAKACDLPLSCRKYSHQLDELFFNEWLGLATASLQKPGKRVNPSLSISELLLIRQLRQQNPVLPELLYRTFLQLPRNFKAQEPRIKSYYKAVLGNELNLYHKTWKTCNLHLPKDTPLSLAEHKAIEPNKVMTFSAQQGEAIAGLMHQLCSPVFLLKLTLIRYKRKLGRLLRALRPNAS